MDETADEERDRRDKHDDLDADPSKPAPGEDGVRRFCDRRAGSVKTG